MLPYFSLEFPISLPKHPALNQFIFSSGVRTYKQTVIEQTIIKVPEPIDIEVEIGLIRIFLS